MDKGKNLKKETMKITVIGKRFMLFFMPEPNLEAAEFIKKTLLNVFSVK